MIKSNFKLENVLNIFSELEFKSLLVKVKDLRDSINKAHGKKTGVASLDSSELKKATERGSGESKFARNAKKFNYQLVNDDKKFASFIKKLKIHSDEKIYI